MASIRSIAAILVLGLLCAPASVRAEEPTAVIKGIRVVKSGENLGVEISADKNLDYNVSKMPQLLRIVIDLPRTDPGRPDTVYKVDSPMISSIRVEKKTINDVMITRVSVNLAENADFAPRLDPSDKKKLTVFLRKAAPIPDVAPATAAEPAGAEKQAAPEQPAASGSPAASAPPAPKTVLTPVVPQARPQVIVGKIVVGDDTIYIQSNGYIPEYKAFTLREPGRLVIDIPAATSTLRSIIVPANRFGIVTVRVGTFQGKLRLVFDAGKKPFPGYEVVTTETGLSVAMKRPTVGKR